MHPYTFHNIACRYIAEFTIIRKNHQIDQLIFTMMENQDPKTLAQLNFLQLGDVISDVDWVQTPFDQLFQSMEFPNWVEFPKCEDADMLLAKFRDSEIVCV